jgi:release factor glutamine methyltransferase
LSELRQIYTEKESDSIARLIMEHLGYQLSDILLHPDQAPSPSTVEQINEFVAEIPTGKPIQYILGQTYFCDLKIAVDNNVLIPRPETEEMVEHIKALTPQPPLTIIDLGTGSGCLALALKHYFPDAEVSGVDISKGALSVARENGRLNNLLINWEEMDLLNEHSWHRAHSFSLVVSNPPYVMNNEKKGMAKNVIGFEPWSALFVEDHDPLIFYRAIASFCNQYLEEKGEVWVEINEQLGKETAGIFKMEGFSQVRIQRDIHEKERYINARR